VRVPAVSRAFANALHSAALSALGSLSPAAREIRRAIEMPRTCGYWSSVRGATEDFYGIMWELVRKVIHEIPDVLDAMGLVPATIERDVKTNYDRRFAAAGLTFAV
jgi:hypothetical protein